MEFMGFRREDGSVGVRNHVAVIPSVFCANKVAERIAMQVEGAVVLTHWLGCAQVGADLELTARVLKKIGAHPNVAALVVVGLGCERFKPTEFVEGVAPSGKSVELVHIQNMGGSVKAVQQGVAITHKLAQKALAQAREPFALKYLKVGLKCGGTDATSGLSANPAVGVMSDSLVDAGGTTFLTEINELLGTEHVLCRRAVNPQVAREIQQTISDMEQKLRDDTSDPEFAHRHMLFSPGNIDGGVSSIVEKAMGGVQKSGNSLISGVVEYGDSPPGNGLYLLNSPSHDGECVTAMVAAGAQIIVFTTGRGNPCGFPIAPVIKVTGNSGVYQLQKDNIDIDASPILAGEETIKEVGERIFQKVLAVANGKHTQAELMGHDELFVIMRRRGRL